MFRSDNFHSWSDAHPLTDVQPAGAVKKCTLTNPRAGPYAKRILIVALQDRVVADIDLVTNLHVFGVKDQGSGFDDYRRTTGRKFFARDQTGSMATRHSMDGSMVYHWSVARIRIVDEWLRSPVSAPTRQRAIMVVARAWAEQRVLMRAFSVSDDQTRPTINLQGAELAIGPAGTDPHGEWGIHVEPPVDGRAQELREALQLAAKLLAGSKGNPPRLQDEVSEFEDRATNNWAPGVAPAVAEKSSYYEPVVGAPSSMSKEIPSSAAARAKLGKTNFRKTPPFWGGMYGTPELAKDAPSSSLQTSSPTPAAAATAPSARRRNRQTFRYSGVVTAQPPIAAKPNKGPSKGNQTVFGYSSAKNQSVSYAAAAGKTMPLGFTLEDSERRVLNELGKQNSMSAAEIGTLLGLAEEPMVWMSKFMDKLAEFGLDLVAPGDDRDGEPTYILTR